MPATATTLEIVSTSDEDGAGTFTGINVIVVQGLDGSLDELTEVIALSGTTPVTTINSYRAMNLSIAAAGGTPGSGAVGEITITSSIGGIIFGKYLVTDTSCEVGRYTVPNGKRLLVTSAVFNGGPGGDMTVVLEVTTLGGFPVSLSELYLGSQFSHTGGLSSVFLEGGTTFKYRGFTNSGNPSTRKLNVNLIGTLASIEDWDSVMC